MRALIAAIGLSIATSAAHAQPSDPNNFDRIIPYVVDELVPMSHVEPYVGSDDLGDFSDDPRPTAQHPQRQTVEYSHNERPGDIVVDSAQRTLYLITAPGEAIRYAVAVGRAGFAWHGKETITRKAKWPDWRPPAEMRRRRPDLPERMAGGPQNPLGARALYLGSTLIRIHGSNEPRTIGRAVSSGCIRMTNEDVIDLYNRVEVGGRVTVR